MGKYHAVVADLVAKGDREAGINLEIETDLKAEVDLVAEVDLEVGEDLTYHLVEINHRA